MTPPCSTCYPPPPTSWPAPPARIKEALLAPFQVQALYNNDTDQVTIWATITSDTPRTIAALLAAPRTDDDTHHVTPAHGVISDLSSTPIGLGAKSENIRPPRRLAIEATMQL